jgi:hypothetical protein
MCEGNILMNSKRIGEPCVSAAASGAVCSGKGLSIAMAQVARMLMALLVVAFGAQFAIAADGPLSLPDALPAQSTTATSAATALEIADAHQREHISLKQNNASEDTRSLADWIIDSGDNQGMPFVIVDKKEAKVFVFHADGELRGMSSALVGLGRGDESVPGIGERKLSSIRPEERTTPAGRFVAALDRDLNGAEILWVDYDTSIAMHPVITTNIKERRAERLASASPLDKRITYGCINVPALFYKNVVSPTFKGTDGIVYVMPDTRSMQQVFNGYSTAQHH